ncbi:MAG: hypothetical protein JWP22_2316 [Ramlibacter sp.]|jgi:hypothetical protein|nr:hypothetical protein [Ramlibacter sp.]MDB5913641.1 hypothetical protein [Ramlibacter sp.]
MPLRLLSTLLVGLLAAGGAWAQAAAPAAPPVAAPPPQTQQQAGTPSVSTQAPIRAASARVATAKVEAKPLWAELTALQQQSLAPLAGTWRSLSEAHKRKWMAVSETYPAMPPGEQLRLHSRMAEWAALSPQQRTQARLNFAESRGVAPSVDKRAKWEAYQALPPEEKRKLAGAAAAKPAPPPTAVAVQPVPEQKLARIPKPRKQDNNARIAVVPPQVNQNTLLPQPGTLSVQP